MKNYLLCIFLAVFTISIYGQNHKNAADYRTDAINGNAIAQFYLGQSYFRGWGIKPDTIQAVYWWRKSAEQGNPAAQNNMGAAYSNGWGNLTITMPSRCAVTSLLVYNQCVIYHLVTDDSNFGYFNSLVERLKAIYSFLCML